MAAVLTDMDVPLGRAVGNSLEVTEAVHVLEGRGPEDLREISLTLASEMLRLATGEKRESAMLRCRTALADGSAKRKLCEMVATQNGDVSYIENPEKFRKSDMVAKIISPRDGWISHMNAEKIGMASSVLGAGREKKGDAIDHSAGIVLSKKTGEFVKCGEPLCELYTNRPESLEEAKRMFLTSVSFSEEKPTVKPLIYEILD